MGPYVSHIALALGVRDLGDYGNFFPRITGSLSRINSGRYRCVGRSFRAGISCTDEGIFKLRFFSR